MHFNYLSRDRVLEIWLVAKKTLQKSSNAQESLVESDHPEEKSDDEDSSSSVEDDHVQSSIPNNKEVFIDSEKSSRYSPTLHYYDITYTFGL